MEQPLREEEEQWEQGDSSCSDEEGDSENDEHDVEEEEEGKDGMADMMAKILHQQVDRGKIPILAKRKTTIMKELEKEKTADDKLKLAHKQKQQERNKFQIVPDHTMTDYERQLRKVATRGVVALFNAITKAKREGQERGNVMQESDTKKQGKAAEVGALSRENFVSLLRKESRQDGVTSRQTKSSNSQEKGGELTEDDETRRSLTSLNKNKNYKVDKDSTATHEKVEGSLGDTSKRAWNALHDNFLIDRKIALKDWDKSEEDSDSGDDEEYDKKRNPNSNIEDPFRELSEYVLKEDKGKKSGKKRNISDYSSDEDVIDYRRKYSKKK